MAGRGGLTMHADAGLRVTLLRDGTTFLRWSGASTATTTDAVAAVLDGLATRITAAAIAMNVLSALADLLVAATALAVAAWWALAAETPWEQMLRPAAIGLAWLAARPLRRPALRALIRRATARHA